MAKINFYLLFNGNCEEAFNFYKSAFGIDFTYRQIWGYSSAEWDASDF